MGTRFIAGASASRRGSAVLLLLSLICASPRATEANPLTPDQQAIIAKIAKSAGGADVQYAEKSTDPFGAEVKLPFRQGKSLTLVRKDTSFRDDGSITWIGEVAETGERAVLMLWGNALLTGYFAYNGTIFAVESLGGGVNAYKELGHGLPDHPAETGRPDGDPATTPTATPPNHAPPEPSVPPFPDKQRLQFEAKNITIDLMLLYTRSVANRYTRDPEDLLALAVEEANEAFRNSGLGNIHLRLVHTQLIDYDTSTGDQFNHLYAMVDGVGPFKDVKKLRNEKRADIVGLIIDNPTGCGLSTRIGPESDEAFFVVHHACATITMSIAHEIGHILGVRHDRYVDETNTPFTYGHGYVDGTKWRDIMSYNVGCGGCPRIPYWSNPRIKYKGDPTGTPAADSARVILELAEHVSHFR
jgi:Metallo-peptidase family M12